MKCRCAVSFSILGASIALAACAGGGGDSTAAAAPPSRVAIVSCFESSGTGGRVYEKERHAEIGALPAHYEIGMVGFEEGNLEGGVVGMYLFKTADEAKQGVAVLKEEEPSASVNTYADGLAVGVVSGAKNPSKDEALLEECAEGSPAPEEAETTEAEASGPEVPSSEMVATCLEEAGAKVKQYPRGPHEEVVALADDEGVIAIYMLNSVGESEAVTRVIRETLKKARPGGIVIIGTVNGGATVTAVQGQEGVEAGVPSVGDETLMKKCATSN